MRTFPFRSAQALIVLTVLSSFLALPFLAEVVLSLLVSNFVFELSDKPIAWNISGIRFPTVGVDGSKPELPLKVSLYKGSA